MVWPFRLRKPLRVFFVTLVGGRYIQVTLNSTVIGNTLLSGQGSYVIFALDKDHTKIEHVGNPIYGDVVLTVEGK